jgi:hypothetical protein
MSECYMMQLTSELLSTVTFCGSMGSRLVLTVSGTRELAPAKPIKYL